MGQISRPGPGKHIAPAEFFKQVVIKAVGDAVAAVMGMDDHRGDIDVGEWEGGISSQT